MGTAALTGTVAQEALPDPVPEEKAREFLGKCFDESDWTRMTNGTGICPKAVLLNTINMRNHAPSLRAWLEHWRIEELHDRLYDLEVMAADDLLDIDKTTMDAFVKSLKPIQKYHWEKAYCHATCMANHPLGYMPWRPEGLMMWLESWRLQRVAPLLSDMGVDVKEDLIDMREVDQKQLELRLLEQKRWDEGLTNLKNLVKSFNYASQRKASIPTIQTWLKSLRLDRLRDQLMAYGAVELVDLADIDENQFKEMKLTRLQSKHWQIGMSQILAARREAMADGKADLATFRGFIESWRLQRIMPQLIAMGATVQQDLLDLDPEEYSLLDMRPLEAKRFEQMMIALEEEFETPPPGEEWTEDNMTRRQWRKQTAQQYGVIPEGSVTRLRGKVEASKTMGANKMDRMRNSNESVSSRDSKRNNFRQTR